MNAVLDGDDARMFEELEELVALEVRDILATAHSEGFERRDVMSALERALEAEIRALESGAPSAMAVLSSDEDAQG